MSSPEQHRVRMSEINCGRSGAAVIVSSCLAMLLFLTMTANSCWAQSYDPAADFEQGFINQTNPNGVWSYGWSSSFTTPITLYDQTAQPGINGPNAQYWISSVINVGESPSAEYNDGPAYDDGNVDFLPNEFLLVSGIEGEYSNLVFTAPTAGTYSITGSWRGCQYGIGVVVGIVVNGDVIFNSTVSSEGQIVPFGTALTLTAGQTVIFSVGPNGGLQNTGLALNITQQTGTFTKLHDFTGGVDGANPQAGVSVDGAGNLYGTASNGGSGYGTVYQLKFRNSAWLFNPLFSFDGSNGAYPHAGVVVGPSNLLYGTTSFGGADGFGLVFKLGPGPTVCKTALCPWTETVLYTFTDGGCDGAYANMGDLYFDQADNIYGTTYNGGCYGAGAAYELTPPGGWGTEHTLYSFAGPPDGANPVGGVISNDNAAHLFGTTEHGGLSGNCTGGGGYSGCGPVFELTQAMGYDYTENLLYSFANGTDGSYPIAGLVFDGSGNLYGATSNGGSGGGGTAYELSAQSGWMTLTILYSFTGSVSGNCPALAGYEGPGPWRSLTINLATGNLYGTTACDGAYGYGNVFELVLSNGSYTYNDLYDFQGGGDGAYPSSSVLLHPNGNLYGTTYAGGTQGVGVVWEITP